MNYFTAKLSFIALTIVFTVKCIALEERASEQMAQEAVPKVTCSSRRIRAVFGPLVKDNLHVKGLSGTKVPVPEAEEQCGVKKVRDKNDNLSFLSRYDSCYAQIEGTMVVISLVVQLTGQDQWFRVNISCPLIKRQNQSLSFSPRSRHGKCATRLDLRVDCGPHGVSSHDCHKLGCCYDSEDSTCYYKMNACSLDGHFVFSVRTTDSEPPVTPSSLTVKGHPDCSPLITASDTAVFKVGFLECGTKEKIEGNFMIYEVEVEEVRTNPLTKHPPFSLQVQCKYDLSGLKHATELRSLYAVTNPPPVSALGSVGVEMRIAKDASFTSFFPADQLPVTFPLRKPIYVEISISQPSPDPTLSLHVRDCFAFPGSRHSVWTLLYDGCPNPLDNMGSSFHEHKQGKTTSHSQVRRFDVKTFAFLDPKTGDPSLEEIYFYCWVEICTEDTDCRQPCSMTSYEVERHKREAIMGSSEAQLISLGPVMLDQNSTTPQENPCEQQQRMLQMTFYMLAAVGTMLLLMMMYMIWSRRRHQQAAEEACDTNAEQS